MPCLIQNIFVSVKSSRSNEEKRQISKRTRRSKLFIYTLRIKEIEMTPPLELKFHEG